MTELLKTPLYQQHLQAQAKIVDFGGWALPVNYGSQIEEHHAVRNHCGVFDVSHMSVSDVTGKETLAFLSKVLANDIESIVGVAGKALYSCMLNAQGGVIDDLIVYYINDQYCRLVTNAGTNEKDMAWLSTHAQAFDVEFNERPELALIAVQGPDALAQCKTLLTDDISQVIDQLERFQGTFIDSDMNDFVGRTGYTGEDGLELIVSAEQAQQCWTRLLEGGVQPCGLGARDTLRLEAGMSLYGNDLDESHTPLESGLKWTVKTDSDRDFIGRQACLKDTQKKMIGLTLLDRGVLRGHQKVYFENQMIGEITSGTFSPTLQKSIALARINTTPALSIGQIVQIEMRNKLLNAEIVPYPFIKKS